MSHCCVYEKIIIAKLYLHNIITGDEDDDDDNDDVITAAPVAASSGLNGHDAYALPNY